MIGSTFARTFQIRGEKFSPKRAKLGRASHINRIFRSYLIGIKEILFLVVSRDGWRIGQNNLYRRPPCVFSIVSTKFHVDRKIRFYSYLVWTSWCFWVFAYIAGRSSRKKKEKEELGIVHTHFSLIVQLCVRVSASNFKVLIRWSGGARASENFIRSWLA